MSMVAAKVGRAVDCVGCSPMQLWLECGRARTHCMLVNSRCCWSTMRSCLMARMSVGDHWCLTRNQPPQTSWPTLCRTELPQGPQDRTHCVCSVCVSCRYLRTGRLDTLLQYDELLQEMQARRVFQVCRHLPLAFLPAL